MITHTKLTEYGMREAIKHTPTFIKIGNIAFQGLYFKKKNFDELYYNYGLACKFGVQYLKDKQNLSSKVVAIIEDVINGN